MKTARHVIPSILLLVLGFVVTLMVGRYCRDLGPSEGVRPPQFIPEAKKISPISGIPSAAELFTPHREVLASSIRPSSALELEVVVVDLTGTPIPGARVALEADGLLSTWANTNAKGECSIALPQARSVSLLVAAKAHANCRQVLPEIPPEQVIIRLRPAVSLSGRVVWADGSAAAQDVTVLAWPDGYEPTLLTVIQAASAESDLGANLLLANTDEGGNFLLEALDEGKTYTISAVTPGGATVPRIMGRRPGDRLTLILQPLYGAIVRLRERGGGQPRVGSNVHGRGPMYYSAEEDDQMSPVLRLLPEFGFFIGSAAIALAAGPDQLLIFESAARRSSKESINYELELPGYEPVWTQLFVEPLSNKTPEYILELDPIAIGWGTLDILCSGVSLRIVPDSITNDRFGILELVGPDGTRFGIVVDKPCCGEVQRVQGVPYGNYEVSFRMQDWIYNYPTAGGRFPLTIGRDAARLELPFESVGAVLMSVIEPNGEEYAGELVIRLYSDGGKLNKYLAFRRAPYTIENLPEGEFTVAVERLPGLEAQAQERCNFTIRDGQIATPTLRLRRP